MTRAAALGACMAIAVTIARTVALGQAGPPADLVLLNARVLTVDARFTVAEALAVRDGRFAAVGTNEAIRRLVGPSTTVIEGRGRTVVPGIIDTHVHSLEVATAEATQPFRNLRSVADIQAWLKEETARRPAGAWLWTPRTYPTRLREHRFPTRQELDAVAPDHPVVVDSAYAFSLNTVALRAAGITRDTPNPQGGAIVKDASGEPTGLLRNAGSLLSKFRRGSQGLTLDSLENVHRHYLAAGITSIIERGASLEGFETYRALKAANRLVVRSTVTIRVPQAGEAGAVQQFIDKLPFKPGEGDAWLKAGPLKLVADGGILIGTSYMRQPYGEGARQLYALDDPKDRGFLSLTPEQLGAAIAAIHTGGWQLVVHVTGDAGVDVVLDGIEAAQKQAPGGNRRHTLIHAYFVNPETAARAAKLGVLVDTQPAWHYKDADALATGLGRGRLAPFIGLQTWRKAGVDVAINTDHMFGVDPDDALNPFNPFLTMYSAVSRRTESGQAIGDAEAVSREDALRMMTSMAARFSFDEQDRGSIETGKLADFAVLSDHFLTVPVERLKSIKPELTVVGGKVAFSR